MRRWWPARTNRASGPRARTVLLLYVAAVFVIVKVAALAVLMWGGSGAGPVAALVPALWLDVLLWSGLFCATVPVRHARALWGLVVGAVPTALFMAGSWTSFHVTQTWLTWQRLRGDENVTPWDVGELDARFAVPMVLLMAGLVALLPLALRIARSHAVRAALERPSLGAMTAASALLLFAVDRQTSHLGLYGLSEQPLVVAVASAFSDPSARSTEPLSPDEWDELHRPTAPRDPGPPPPPLGQPKNLVLYLAEGIAAKQTSFPSNNALATTPHAFRRFADHGLWFDSFYVHTHRSAHALFSVVCSEYPPPTMDAITALNPRIDCGSLMETLAELPDMHQGLFHGGRFSFANKLTFLGGRGFETTVDAVDLSDPPRWQESWWGIDDRAVVDAALAFVDAVPEDERFFLFVVPLAPHHPFRVPPDAGVPDARGAGPRSPAHASTPPRARAWSWPSPATSSVATTPSGSAGPRPDAPSAGTWHWACSTEGARSPSTRPVRTSAGCCPCHTRRRRMRLRSP